MNFFFWRSKEPTVLSEKPAERSPLEPGQFYCEKCGRVTYFAVHKPFCSAECKFNLTGTANYPVDRKPRGKRRDEKKHFYFHAHGIMHGNRQDAISRCVRGESLQLIREPQNPCDKNAIRILRASGEDVGYVPRDDAADLAPKMDQGQSVRAEVDWLSSRDGDFRHFGLKVRVGLLKEVRS